MQLRITPDTWEEILNGFQSKTNFPHYIGAVDGNHFNYKDYFSIVLLAVVVDSEYSVYICKCEIIWKRL